MGLVVMFCYIQVTLVMPSFLFLWQRYLSRVEYLYFIICLKKKNVTDSDSVSSGEQDSTDSGIVLMSYLVEQEQNFDNKESDYQDTSDDEADTLVPMGTQNPVPNQLEVANNEATIVTVKYTIQDKIETGMKKMAAGVQWVVLKYIAWPLVYVRVPLLCVFVLLLVISIIITSFLKPSDKPPQFLDSDSNIQKLLDLQSEVAQQSNDYDCWNCSGYFVLSDYSNPSGVPSQTTVTSLPTPSSTHSTSSSSTSSSSSSSSSNSGTSTSSHSSSHQRSSSSTVVKPSSTVVPIQTTSSSHIKPTSTAAAVRPTTSSHRTTTTTYTEPPTGNTHHHQSTTHGQQKTTTPTATPPPQVCSGKSYQGCVNNQAEQPAFGGGAVVYVVFGISGIERTFSPSHVIPQDNLVRTHYNYDDYSGKNWHEIKVCS